jgi:L-lactate dehydrogenase complex protein LldF
MHQTSEHFVANAHAAMGNAQLQPVLNAIAIFLPAMRQGVLAQTPDFEPMRDYAVRMKDHTLEHLDAYLADFTERVRERGGQVYEAATAAELNGIVADICRRAGARRVIKGKSMVAEETALNEALEAEALEVIETDLGEYIIQRAGEPPSHIIGPALHKTRAQVAELFRRHHDLGERELGEVKDLVREARAVLREGFLAADVGITGANCLVAETGSTMLVTNEGNGDLCSTLPRVHIVVAGIEKLVPTLEDASALHRVLCRSATGQVTSAYTTFYSGPRGVADADGPEEFHVVLLDNGRREILRGKYRSMLRCIRCGACLNHCPIYRHVGGHAYGWVYPGPMGSVLTPLLTGLERSRELPNACTACGRCEEACPMRIPLPEHLRQLRDDAAAQGLAPPVWRAGVRGMMTLFRFPFLYRLAADIARPLLTFLSHRPGLLARLPILRGWAAARRLPAPQGHTFLGHWQKVHRARDQEHRL